MKPTQLPSVVWLARHAETAVPTMFHGFESDVDLGEHGNRQAQAAAGWFVERKPTAVISSGMIRAHKTAAPIATACGVAHHVELNLHERKVGPLTKMPRDEANRVWDDTTARWIRGETGYSYPGMESFEELRNRTLPAFNRVVSAHPGGRIVIVCHGVVCKVLLLSILHGRSHADWVNIGKIPNLALSELVPDGDKWRAESLLLVPPPVVAVNDLHADPNLKKTEA